MPSERIHLLRCEVGLWPYAQEPAPFTPWARQFRQSLDFSRKWASGRPRERIAERWYFRPGVLVLDWWQRQEFTESHRAALETLEQWLTSCPEQASNLAFWLTELGLELE